MRIFKYPQFDICTCARCGTVFQPEVSDVIEYRFLNLTEARPYIRCPVCEELHEITKIGETDTNVGSKYFTPEQVRAMSREEVHKNYYAIMESMKTWGGAE